ncbi:MAG: ribonuclease J, partial [Myxococcales bacterium]|nr:ribonuclease J [Myxococcales bacterium]
MIDPLRILFVGGSSEVGMNATLYLQGGEGVLVDFGALLQDQGASCIQRIVPGLEPFPARGRRLVAVVITHGHEDHIGALPHLLDRLKVPVYAPPFALGLVRARLERDHPEVQADLRPLRPRTPIRLGPFEVEWVAVTHSIPDTGMVLLRSSAGAVLHTGDFKLDEAPTSGSTDYERLAQIGDEGLDLLLADSTNARAERSKLVGERGPRRRSPTRSPEPRVVSWSPSCLRTSIGCARSSASRGRPADASSPLERRSSATGISRSARD